MQRIEQKDRVRLVPGRVRATVGAVRLIHGAPPAGQRRNGGPVPSAFLEGVSVGVERNRIGERKVREMPFRKIHRGRSGRKQRGFERSERGEAPAGSVRPLIPDGRHAAERPQVVGGRQHRLRRPVRGDLHPRGVSGAEVDRSRAISGRPAGRRKGFSLRLRFQEAGRYRRGRPLRRAGDTC